MIARKTTPYIPQRRTPSFPTEAELAWQAGIIDGEGTITISRQIRAGRPSPAFRAFVSVTNTNVDLVLPFVEMWGGRVYRSIDSRAEKRWADSFAWYCPLLSVSKFLLAIKPYLRAKNKQAELVLDFIKTAKAFPRYKGSFSGGSRGGSAPLGEEEIKHREFLTRQIRLLNAKSATARAELKGGDANAAENRRVSI